MNQTLDELARAEIREAMTGLQGTHASTRAAQLAEAHGVSTDTIYTLTRDLRPRRKRRADRGSRKVDPAKDDGIRFARELVVNKHLKPSLALEIAQREGHEITISEGTFRRHLKHDGISRRQRMKTLEPYREFEASAPGEIFQFDISGLKERWYEDVKSRKILRVDELEVSGNHPNANPNRVQCWSFALVDDFSRRIFVRYVAVDKPNSTHVATFLLAAFRELGVPLKLYTDGDKIIHSKRMLRVEQLLDQAFTESGGFVIEKHLPGNAKATGKVEVVHKWIEEINRLISVNDEKLSIDQLNFFAANFCERKNNTTHRATGMTPMNRWQSVRSVVRIPPPATLDAAFLAQEFKRRIRANLTVTLDGQVVQLPRQSPLTDWAALNHEVTLVVPHQGDWLVVIGQDGTEVLADRVHAQRDNAGDFKSIEQTPAQKLRKELKDSFKERKQKRREEGGRFNVPLVYEPDAINHPIAFPKPTIEMPAEAVAALPGAQMLAGPSHGRLLNYYEAFDLLSSEGAEFEARWLKTLFAASELIEEAELWQALKQSQTPTTADILPFERRA